MRSRFPDLQYVDLVCGDVVKSAWVLPLAAQTTQTGTLATFMSSLGLSICLLYTSPSPRDAHES
eukprot:4707777-Prymnesium_polylepis.2